MNKAQEAIAQLEARHEELAQIGKSYSSAGIENLKRWKDRTARTIAEFVSEAEAQKFMLKKIGLMNVNADANANLDSNVEHQESYLVSLLEDIQAHPNDYFGEPSKMQVPGTLVASPSASALRLLHGAILRVSEKKFADGHYSDSVLTAFLAVNMRVKAHYKNKKGRELDGAALMTQAFSLNDPVIKLDDMGTETGKSVQQGYMQIFAGSMTGIRNPKAHEIISIDAIRAVHFLFLASLEMHKLDEAKVPS